VDRAQRDRRSTEREREEEAFTESSRLSLRLDRAVAEGFFFFLPRSPVALVVLVVWWSWRSLRGWKSITLVHTLTDIHRTEIGCSLFDLIFVEEQQRLPVAQSLFGCVHVSSPIRERSKLQRERTNTHRHQRRSFIRSFIPSFIRPFDRSLWLMM